MVLGHSDYHYQHEPIHYGWKGKNRPWFGARDKVSTLEFDRPKRTGRVVCAMELATKFVAVNLERLSALGLEPKMEVA